MANQAAEFEQLLAQTLVPDSEVIKAVRAAWRATVAYCCQQPASGRVHLPPAVAPSACVLCAG